jgi:hypothetical protein
VKTWTLSESPIDEGGSVLLPQPFLGEENRPWIHAARRELLTHHDPIGVGKRRMSINAERKAKPRNAHLEPVAIPHLSVLFPA